jgi:hypothetical protein
MVSRLVQHFDYNRGSEAQRRTAIDLARRRAETGWFKVLLHDYVSALGHEHAHPPPRQILDVTGPHRVRDVGIAGGFDDKQWIADPAAVRFG